MRKKENFKNLISDTMDNDQRRGFTMVELIVVLVILAILAAVAIPALLGFIDNAREKQYIADAEASLKATQSALTEVYNNASNRVHPDRRKVAHEESGTGINTSFKVWTVNNLQDGETAAIADNIASYTVAYALFTAEDGTRVFYNGKSWELCKAGEDISDLAGYGDFVNENVIYMWDYQSDTAYDPNRNPDYENNQFAEDVIIDSATGLRIRFMGDGKLTFSKDGSDNDETYVDYYADSTDYETSDAQIAALAGKLAAFELKIMEIFKPDSLKWTCTVGEETFILDSYAAAIKNAVELYNTDKVADGEVIYKAVLEGDTISFTARFAPYDPKIQLVNGGDVASYVFTYDAISGDITYGEGNNKVNIDDMNLNSLISGSQNTTNVPEDGAVEYSGRWILYTGTDTEGKKEYEMQGDVYKEYSLQNGGTNNVKDYIKNSITALASGTSDVDEVTFETPANICKTVHYKAYTDNISTDDDGNISDDDFDPDGSSKEESNKVTFNGVETVSVDYHKNEIDKVVRDENDTVIDVDYTDYDSDGDGLVDVAYNSYGVEGYSNPVTWEKVKRGERFKFWLISDSDKEGNIDENNPDQIKVRPKKNDSDSDSDDQRDCLNVILARLFAEGNYHFGQVAELDLSDINALLVNNDMLPLNSNESGDLYEIDVTGKYRNQPCILRSIFNELSGGSRIGELYDPGRYINLDNKNYLPGANYNIKTIQYKTPDDAAALWNGLSTQQRKDSRQMCISVTELAKKSDYKLEGFAKGDGTGEALFDFTIEKEDPEYPAYVVAFSVKDTDGKYNIYIFSEDDCYVKAKSTFQCAFAYLDNLTMVDFVERIDTSEVTRLKGMFQHCVKLEDINISNISSERTTDITNMFRDCSKLENLHIENINTGAYIHFFDGMFLNCSSLRNVYTEFNPDGGALPDGNVSITIDISKAYNLARMFSGCTTLESIKFVGGSGEIQCPLGANNPFTGGEVGNNSVKELFKDCTNLKNIAFENLNVTNSINYEGQIKNISSLSVFFTNCLSQLESVTFKNCRFDHVTDVSKLFKDCTALKTLDMSGLSMNHGMNGEGVVGQYMFSGCTQLEEGNPGINVNLNGDFYFKDTSYMFSGCNKLNDAQPFDIDTTKTVTFNNMFENCTGITGVQEIRIDSANSLNFMFINCTGIEEITLKGGRDENPGYNANLGSTKNLFDGCTSLTKIRLDSVKSEMNDSNRFKRLFQYSSDVNGITFTPYGSVTDVEIDNCDFSKLVEIKGLFTGNDIIQLFKFTDSSFVALTGMPNAFENCNSINSVVIKDVTMSDSGLNATAMFKDCTQLTGNEVGFVLDEDLYFINTSNMFRNCTSITTAQPYGINTTRTVTMNSMFEDCTGLDGNIEIQIDSAGNISYLFKGCSQIDSIIFKGGSDGCNAALTNYNEVLAGCTELTSIEVSNLVSDTNINGFKGLFSLYNGRNFASYESVSDFKISGSTFSELESFNNLFARNTIIESFIMENSSFDKLTGMKEMFSKCTNLTSVKFENVTTSNAGVDGTSMFEGCTQSNFTGVNVADFKLDGGFDFINTSRMFYGCTSLTTAVPYNINTSKVTAMDEMFYGCTGLVNINLSGLSTGNVTTMKNMFNGCSSIEQITMGGSFDTAKVEVMEGMFQNCKKLTRIINTNGHLVAGSSLTTVKNMFYNCELLTCLDLRGFGTCDNLTSISCWFYNCKKMSYIDLTNFTTSSQKLSIIDHAFYNLGYANPVQPSGTNIYKPDIYGCMIFAGGIWENCASIDQTMDDNFRINLYGTTFKNATKDKQSYTPSGGKTQGDPAHLSTVTESQVRNKQVVTDAGKNSARAWFGYFMDAGEYYQNWAANNPDYH